MNHLYDHPVRIVLGLTGIALALASYTFFDAPMMMIPAALFILRLLISGKRILIGTGGSFILLTLVLYSLDLERLTIVDFRFEKVITYGSLTSMILAILHLGIFRPKASDHVRRSETTKGEGEHIGDGDAEEAV